MRRRGKEMFEEESDMRQDVRQVVRRIIEVFESLTYSMRPPFINFSMRMLTIYLLPTPIPHRMEREMSELFGKVVT